MAFYENLGKPITIKGVEIRNRIFLPPMVSGFAKLDHSVDERLIAHYERIAKGGIGLITTEAAEVSPLNEHEGLPELCITNDDKIDGFAKLAEAVHKHGAKVAIQLFCRVMDPNQPSIEELHRYKDDYVKAAVRVKASGADGVEIHCGHANALLGTLMSGDVNHRVDEYGGDILGRGRLTLEIIKEIRAAVGEDFLISARVGSDDLTEGGTSWKESIILTRELQKAGIDFVHLSNGSLYKMTTMFPSTGSPAAMHLDNQMKVKSAINLPSGIVARIKDPAIADMLIEQGYCDFVYIGRQNLADPEFSNKVLSGNYDEVIPCIGCLECIRGELSGETPNFFCSMNPSTGDFNVDIQPTCSPKKVAVIGGGPGGMEAALTAVKMGHNVTLFEKDNKLGGQLLLASMPPAKQEYTRGIIWYSNQLKKYNVDVRLGIAATVEMIKKEGFDKVILATGAEPVIPGFIQNSPHPQVVNAWDVLNGKVACGERVVVIGGGAVGCETADRIATHWGYVKFDRHVTILEMTNIVDPDVSPNRVALMDRLNANNVKIEKCATVKEITESAVIYEQYGEMHTIHSVDTVVVATGARPVNALAPEFEAAGINVQVIGDAVKVAKIVNATGAGRKAALKI